MALKFKMHSEKRPYYKGRDLFREIRNNPKLSRGKFARRMEEFTGICWYETKVIRREQKKRNYVTKKEMQVILRALEIQPKKAIVKIGK